MAQAKAISLCLTVALVFICIVETTVAAPEPLCLPNNEGCQPDGSWGNCCSGYCYKQVGWNMGICVNQKALPNACLSNGLACKSDGSRGLCCSGFCLQHAGAEWGVCQ